MRSSLGTNEGISPVSYSLACQTHPAHFFPSETRWAFSPSIGGCLIFNAYLFIFDIAQAIPAPALSPVIFDPCVSGVQSGTFHSLPPLNSFLAARPLKPGAICQPKRVLINTGGPRLCDLATCTVKGRGQSRALAMFSLRDFSCICWRGRESLSFLLSFLLSFHEI